MVLPGHPRPDKPVSKTTADYYQNNWITYLAWIDLLSYLGSGETGPEKYLQNPSYKSTLLKLENFDSVE